MKKTLLVLAVVLCPLTGFAQTVTSIGTSAVKAADDFATRALQDPWDMNERTDIGWFLNGTDGPPPNISNPTFSGGVFSGTSTNADPNFFLLESGNPFAARLGKIGTNFPIDASTYKVLAFRMSVSSIGGNNLMQAIWYKTTQYDDPSTLSQTFGIPVSAGFRTYLIDLTNPPTGVVPGGVPWSGSIGVLRLDPTGDSGVTIQLDWARLVNVDATLCRTITWTGAATVDIYLDNDNNAANGNLGPIALGVNQTAANANSASPGCSTAGAGFKYYAGALASGTYRVAVVNTGGTPGAANYSPTTWVVNEAPTLTFTSPSEEGSADDFATTVLGNAWDMNSAADLDTITNVNSPQFTTLPLETPAGVSLGSQNVFLGTSIAGPAAGFGDPYVDPCFVTVRCQTKRIDPTKYRILTLEMGYPNEPRNIALGSIARIVWRVAGTPGAEFPESVSDDIIVNSRAGANVADKIIVDMADRSVLPIEQGSQLGWVPGSTANPGLDIFRVDPHEFTPATSFFIKRIKLASLERVGGASPSYTIRWQYSEGSGTVDLFYDSDGSGFDGTLIAQNQSAAGGQFVWNIPSNITLPQVFIYAVFTDGTNSNRTYAKWPILLTNNAAPTLSVNRPLLNFGVTAVPVNTSAQTVRVNVTGSGTPAWCVNNPSPSIFSVSPASGTGNSSFSVSLNGSNFPTGSTQSANLTVGPCSGSAITNTATVRVVVRALTFAGNPNGAMDTPAEGATVSGSIAVTGWVVDDVDITQVAVYRDPVAGESGSRIFIGLATRVDDARPDIAAFSPDSPFQYRAGWGYLVLTNFLPNGGTGNYRLLAYATDRDGHEVLLGTRNIVGANSTSFVPFGAIDTPDQGQTISGSNFANFGWVLVRGTAKANPPGGGTVTVIVDGVALGTPAGWVARADLTSLFPAATFSGVANALGVFNLDTTTMANGVHTIAWIVTATNGLADGIGSRFFNVQNAVSGLTTASKELAAPYSRRAGADLGRRPIDVGPADLTTPVRAGVGYRTASLPIGADATGLRTIVTRPLDRVVVDASAGTGHSYEAYALVGGRLAPLPIGATFDARHGKLYWQPGVGFVGAYDFVIVRDGYLRTPVRVVLSGAPSPTRSAALVPAFRTLFTTEH